MYLCHFAVLRAKKCTKICSIRAVPLFCPQNLFCYDAVTAAEFEVILLLDAGQQLSHLLEKILAFEDSMASFCINLLLSSSFLRRRRDLMSNLTIKNCDKVEKFKKFKTILVKSLKKRRRFDVRSTSLSSQQ